MDIANKFNEALIRKIIKNSYHACPSFFLIGALRSGIFALNQWLLKIEQIKKIINNRMDENISTNKRYLRQFPLKENIPTGCIIGERDPYLLYRPHSPEKKHILFPDTKLIVILINPTDRALIDFCFAKKYNPSMKNITFEQALLRENDNLEENEKNFAFRDKGKYAEQLKRWFKYYDRNNFLILENKELFKNKEKSLIKVCNFLGVKFNKIDTYERESRFIYPLKEKTRIELVEYFKPHNQELYDLLGVDYKWDK